MPAGLEIERKYLIRMPDEAFLATVQGAYVANITQTYLVPAIPRQTERVRKSEKGGKTVYTHTVKISAKNIVRYEEENAISEEQYNEYLKRADKELSPIVKRRWKIPMEKGLYAEIDIYPFWKKQAICEVETETVEQTYTLPDFIEVIREVSEDKDYTNRSMAFFAPLEDEDL